MNPPLLELRDITVSFRGHEAVRGLNLTLHRGETLALVGESGCGKSTTALAVIRLVPRPGRITGAAMRLDGLDLLPLPIAAMRRLRGTQVAMIFQEPMTSLNPVMTVGRQIVEAIRQHRTVSHATARTQAIELLDLVRIPDPARCFDNFPHRLSGGMRQRVMIAIAVACRPKLLIADEPTTALDVTVQAQILDLLQSLKRQLGMGLLLITHDLGVVTQWADRVAVMYAGRKVEEATPAVLFEQPIHPYTRGLLGATLWPEAARTYRDGRLPEIPGSVVSAAAASGCVFAPRCSLVQPECRINEPPLTEVGTDHLAACPIVLHAKPHVPALR
jgi:peptide/nickel transport system ATP-binding protein